MRGKRGIFFFPVMIAAILCGCVSLETYIESGGEGYTVFPVTIEQKWFSGPFYHLDNYTLTYEGGAEYEGVSGKIKTERYVFSEDNRRICALEIIETSDKQFNFFSLFEKEGDKHVYVFSLSGKYVKLIYRDGISHEYKINTENDFYPEEKYVSFEDGKGGTVRVNNYYGAVSKDKTKYYGEYRMGFDFIVNNERYGILALTPRAFYLAKSGKPDRNMALFILATLVSMK